MGALSKALMKRVRVVGYQPLERINTYTCNWWALKEGELKLIFPRKTRPMEAK